MLQWGHAFSGVETKSGKGGRKKDKSFNGATPFQAWKRREKEEQDENSKSFNGATPFQAWKLVTFLHKSTAAGLLQWGHAFSGVETGGTQADSADKGTASMGPRLFRRGN